MKRNTKIASLFLVLFHTACGHISPDFSSISSESQKDYQAWCQDWGLNCKVPDAPNGGTQGRAPRISQPEWNAIAKVIRAFLKSESQFSMTRSELKDAQLTETLGEVGLGKLAGLISGLLDSIGWSSLSIGGTGQIQLNFDKPNSTLALKNGLTMKVTQDVVTIGFEQGRIQISGLAWQGPQGDVMEIQDLGWSSESTLDVQSASGFVIKNVPMNFLAPELSLPEESVPSSFPIAVLLRRLASLRDWIIDPARQIKMDEEFFQTLATEAGVAIKNPQVLTLKPLVESLASVQILPEKPHVRAALAEGTKNVRCTISRKGIPNLIIEFTKSFGVEDFKNLDSDRVEFSIYGVMAKVDLGAAKPGFELSKLEITPSDLIVKGIPVIQEWKVPWKDLSPRPGSQGSGQDSRPSDGQGARAAERQQPMNFSCQAAAS